MAIYKIFLGRGENLNTARKKRTFVFYIKLK